jgi:hypothetical protein
MTALPCGGLSLCSRADDDLADINAGGLLNCDVSAHFSDSSGEGFEAIWSACA